MKKSQIKSHWPHDRWMICTALILLALGLVMVASASMVISDRQYNYPFHYLVRQCIYLVLGLSLATVITRIPIELWKRMSGYLFMLTLVLLVIVLIPGIGRVVNGSRRWIYFGIFSLQVSEVIKLTAIIYLASYCQRFQGQIQTQAIGLIKPLALLAIIGLLLLLQPDFGAAAVISLVFLMVLFIAGVKLRPFFLLFFIIAGSMAALALLSPYRLERLTTFINPWHHQFGSGYQLTQSLIAFGRGGLLGVGLGNSVQKLFYLPEAHTDFLFAVLGEELGLIGEIILIALFTVLIVRVMYVANQAQRKKQLFHAFLAYGLGLWLALQVIINIGVNIGLLPTKGLTLPLMSYGGSSMLINCVVIGIMLRISYETTTTNDNMPKKPLTTTSRLHY